MNKKAYVLGTGESLNKCPFLDGWETWGVNDIFAYHPVDYLVNVNHPADFNPERLKVINESTPKAFYSQYSLSWSHREDYKKIVLGHPIDLKATYASYSITSPFVAAVLAYKSGASCIVIYGVDLLTHRNFRSANRRMRITNDFKKLREQIEVEGKEIYVGSKTSILSDVLPVWS